MIRRKAILQMARVNSKPVGTFVVKSREKIKDHANWKIATIWGIGYKFEVR